MAKKLTTNETAQRAADASIDLAQQLEAIAKSLRADAKHYRAGELLTGYSAPEGASAEYLASSLMHPAARAIDTLRNVRYRVEDHITRNTTELSR